MLAGQRLQDPSTREVVWTPTKPITMVIIPILAAQKDYIGKRLCLLDLMPPMLGACTKCTGMSWSGVAIVMGNIPAVPKQTLKAHQRGRCELFVVVLIRSEPECADRRPEGAKNLPPPATSLVFAWSSRINICSVFKANVERRPSRFIF